MQKSFDVAIIGSGVIGVTTAYYLNEAGLSVVVFDRNKEAASGISHANGGLLTPSMAEPWAAPGLPAQILSWIGKENAPFLLRSHALPGLLRWGTAFIRNCNEKRWRKNIQDMSELALQSQKHLQALVKKENLEFSHRRSGSIQLFQNKAQMVKAANTAKALQASGISCRRLDKAACLSIEPALEQSKGAFSGGLFYPDDGVGDCRVFTQNLAKICAERGVTFHQETEIRELRNGTEIQAGTGVFDAINTVLATGFPPKYLLNREQNKKLLTYPVKGYTATVQVENINQIPKIPLVDNSRKIAVTRLGTTLRLAGTAEFTGFNKSMNKARVANLLQMMQELLPDIGPFNILHEWTELRPMSPSGSPYIEQLGPNLYANLSHGHLGWTNAAGAAVKIRDLILRRANTCLK